MWLSFALLPWLMILSSFQTETALLVTLSYLTKIPNLAKNLGLNQAVLDAKLRARKAQAEAKEEEAQEDEDAAEVAAPARRKLFSPSDLGLAATYVNSRVNSD